MTTNDLKWPMHKKFKVIFLLRTRTLVAKMVNVLLIKEEISIVNVPKSITEKTARRKLPANCSRVWRTKFANSTNQVIFNNSLPHLYHTSTTPSRHLSQNNALGKPACIEVDIIEENEVENDVAQETDMSKINSDAPVEQTGT